MSFAAIATTAITGAVSAGTSIASGVAKGNLADKQSKRSDALRKDAKSIKAKKIEQEFYDNKMISENKVLSGLPSLNQMGDKLNQQGANAINQSRLSTNNSGDLLSAIAAISGKTNDANMDLGIKDAAYKDGALSELSANNQAIAAAKIQQEALAQSERSKLLDAAGGLENAATANKMKATDTILQGVNAVGGLVGDAVGGAIGKDKGGDKKIDGEAAAAKTQTPAAGIVLDGSIAIPEKTPEVDLEANLTPEQRTALKRLIRLETKPEVIQEWLINANKQNATK